MLCNFFYTSVLSVLVTVQIWATDDLLRPLYNEEGDRRFKILLTSLVDKGLKYDVTSDIQNLGSLGSNHLPRIQVIYKLKINDDIQQAIASHDLGFMEYYYVPYLQDKKYSYYVAILIASKIGLATNAKIDFIENKSKESYDSALDKNMAIIINQLNPQPYKYLLILDATPANYQKSLFSCYENGNSDNLIGAKRLALHDYYDNEFMKYIKLAEHGDPDSIANIDFSKSTIDMWLYRLIAERANSADWELFFSWLGAHPNEWGKSAVLAMSLLVADGYVYDNSRYELSPTGAKFLQFIVQHPVAENAYNVQILLKGGCDEYIHRLMNEFKTTEPWEKLLSSAQRPMYEVYKRQKP